MMLDDDDEMVDVKPPGGFGGASGSGGGGGGDDKALVGVGEDKELLGKMRITVDPFAPLEKRQRWGAVHVDFP
jgi:hypothetical protein